MHADLTISRSTTKSALHCTDLCLASSGGQASQPYCTLLPTLMNGGRLAMREVAGTNNDYQRVRPRGTVTAAFTSQPTV